MTPGLLRSLTIALSGVAAAVAAPLALGAGQDISPEKSFSFKYVSTKPGIATHLKYRVELQRPPGAEQPPVARGLILRFAKGTAINLKAVKPCTATDQEISDGGANTCRATSVVARGKATVYTGQVDALPLDAKVSATGTKTIVVILSNGANVVSKLRGTVSSGTLKVAIPPLKVGDAKVALVSFALDIGAGTKAKPVFRTPRTCTKAGWTVAYEPTFDTVGRIHITDVTRCAPIRAAG